MYVADISNTTTKQLDKHKQEILIPACEVTEKYCVDDNLK